MPETALVYLVNYLDNLNNRQKCRRVVETYAGQATFNCPEPVPARGASTTLGLLSRKKAEFLAGRSQVKTARRGPRWAFAGPSLLQY
eukprot:4063914-Pleurochrysis_carterae.AAC.1